jgi:thiamine-monophosphate kinase
MGEDRLIAWLREEVSKRGHDALGDDAAFLERESWAVSVDQQTEGTHFAPGTGPSVVARRLLAVNLSDLAASGSEPAYGLLAAAVPRGFRLKTFFRAFLDAARDHGLELVGGDIARARRASFSLTVFGRRTAGGRWLRRDAGRVGDALWLGGSLGESAAGRVLITRGARMSGTAVRLPTAFCVPRLAAPARSAVRRHLAPRPQLELGRWLSRRRRAAAIDVSDGLLLDLERLCRASGVAARIDARKLPLSPGFSRLADALGCDPLELAAGGGEDYVLLAALPPTVTPPAALSCRRIGEVVAGEGVELHGTPQRPRRRGWDHLA